MKKSKIIIPALGMLLLSTAASVTGTVAWFTSMQSAEANITSFAVTKTGGSLQTVMAAGVGTKKDSDTSVSLKDGVTLTHGSYDHTSDSMYKPNDTLDVFTAVTRASAEAANAEYLWSVDGNSTTAGTVFYAVSWSITFTYTFGADNHDVYLFFDGSVWNESTNPNASKFTQQKQADSSTTTGKYTYKGFRIAMRGTNVHPLIWAPGTNTAEDEKYQGGTTNAETDIKSYAATNAYNVNGNLIDSTGVTAQRAGALTNPTSRADYLGTFPYASKDANNKFALTLNCVAWFEGNDSNVVDSAELDQVTAKMAFYTRVAA